MTNILKNAQNTSAQSNMRRCGNMALAFGLQEDAVRDIRKLFQTVDLDGSGALSLSEFSEAMMISVPHPIKNGLLAGVQHHGHQSGRPDHFHGVSGRHHEPDAVDIAELNDAFTLLDSNSDGYISLEEIRQIYSFKHMKKKRQTLHGPDSSEGESRRLGQA